MSNHASGRQLELYVLGALEPEGSERLERHVRGCPRCADALAAEARFEVELQALLPAARGGTVVALPARAPALRPRRSYSGAAAAAIAVLVGLWGVEATRLGPANAPASSVRIAEEAPVGALVCELDPAEPMCPSPPLSFETKRAALSSPDICRLPAGGICHP
jgi:anti-sigma factor RsiW